MKKLLLALTLLQGCASPPYWQKTWEGAKTVEVYHVPAAPWPGVQGWTTCDKTRRDCKILLVEGANENCVLKHEMKHAHGWDHPSYTYSFSCWR